MKLNLEVDIDWIGEDMDIDDTVKENIINAIVNKIKQGTEEKVSKKVGVLIDKTIIENINNKTDELFKDFMNREISLSDNYGSSIQVFDSVEALIKQRFDKFMTESVDDKGEVYSGYGSKHTRLTFIVDKQLKDYANTFTTQAVKKVSEEIKLHVNEGLTKKLGSELMKVLKVNQLIGLESKN